MKSQSTSGEAPDGFTPAAYDQDGFCYLSGLVSASLIDQFESEIAALANAQIARRAITRHHSGREPLIDLFKIGGAYRTLLYKAIHQLPVLGEISRVVFQQLREGGVLDALGFQAPLLSQGIRVDIPGETDFMLPMHQDYAHLWALPCARIWLPLRPVGPGIGSMSVVAGSHRDGFVPHNMSDPKYPFLDSETFDADDEIVLELPAGDGVIFSPFLFHASQHKTGSGIKFVMAVHIQDGGRLIDPDDKDDPVVTMMEIHHQRSAARES